MLSVIIPTLNSERLLVPTLASLVSGATTGLIREVLVVDGGSNDETAAVADVAGCIFMKPDAPAGGRLKAAAAVSRASWLMFVRPGTILDAPWTSDTGRFLQGHSTAVRAAVFRRSVYGRTAWRDALSLLTSALRSRPSPAQGLIISKAFYQALGGHSDHAADPESDLIRRIGRHRIETLAAAAFAAAPDT